MPSCLPLRYIVAREGPLRIPELPGRPLDVRPVGHAQLDLPLNFVTVGLSRRPHVKGGKLQFLVWFAVQTCPSFAVLIAPCSPRPPARIWARLDISAAVSLILAADFHGGLCRRLSCGLSGSSWSGGRVRRPLGRWRGVTGPGWSGRRGGRVAGRFEQGHPLVFAVQPPGRRRVRSPLPCRAVRAATSIRSRRSVAPRALA